MPKRTDIKSILVIGAGPIIIGQACEFDYSGTQACKALKDEGYRIILVNSNPATIMTDPSVADRTYIEPLTPEFLTKIIEKERPDAVLPTVGGQTALNLSMELSGQGVFKKYNVEMIGANAETIHKAEARNEFKKAIEKIGLSLPESIIAYTIEEAEKGAESLGYPCVVRPAFTLGGTGGGIVYNRDQLLNIVEDGLRNSLISEVLIEESIIGWKEFELEVMRDVKDNVVIVCSIENIDPMGVHTGDSITVAPAQTLTDREYQSMRDAAISIIREIGVETGGSNIQFAINPENGRMIVIEMNPRVSRSSALASKATGFPIAKFAAKLAVGYTLDEIDNDITKKTPACFEPTLDYVVVKIPRFNFEKFTPSPTLLGTAMKSVGEAMSIGRTFKEAFQKGIRSMEIKRFGYGHDGVALKNCDKEEIIKQLKVGHPDRIFYIKEALDKGISIDEIYDITKIDKWFLFQINDIVEHTKQGIKATYDDIREAKRKGFSDLQLSRLMGYDNELEFRKVRKELGVLPTYNLVDTCSGEFEAYTPYYYSSYETETENNPSSNKKVMILGGGPNRIGQGIEFDYCCVHAAFAIKEEGFESIMVNSNPETVSTDFDISDKLYFEPLTLEDVLNIYESEKADGVIVQFGGQTPLNLAKSLENAGVNLLGTSSDSIDLAEDRERFKQLLKKLNLKQPENATATTLEEAEIIAEDIGYPVVVRPSYVLGGASMKIVYTKEKLKEYMGKAKDVSPSHPILVDKYLENAIEVDVDSLSDGRDCVLAGIMEHIEEAGIHSGDSACSLPPFSLNKFILEEIKTATKGLAKELNVVGLMNIQFAVKEDLLYVIEVNPRASRTVPFVSKVTGVPWAKLATKVMLGKTIQEMGVKEVIPKYFAVKEAVFPFKKFPGVDILLGPEMKSTGEVMGIDHNFETAFLKSQIAASQNLPETGTVLISVKESDKPRMVPIAKSLKALGFNLIATSGTSAYLEERDVKSDIINKIADGEYRTVDAIKDGKVQLVIITSPEETLENEKVVRQEAFKRDVPVVTTIPGAVAIAQAIHCLKHQDLEVKALQDYLPELIPV